MPERDLARLGHFISSNSSVQDKKEDTLLLLSPTSLPRTFILNLSDKKTNSEFVLNLEQNAKVNAR